MFSSSHSLSLSLSLSFFFLLLLLFLLLSLPLSLSLSLSPFFLSLSLYIPLFSSLSLLLSVKFSADISWLACFDDVRALVLAQVHAWKEDQDDGRDTGLEEIFWQATSALSSTLSPLNSELTSGCVARLQFMRVPGALDVCGPCNHRIPDEHAHFKPQWHLAIRAGFWRVPVAITDHLDHESHRTRYREHMQGSLHRHDTEIQIVEPHVSLPSDVLVILQQTCLQCGFLIRPGALTFWLCSCRVSASLLSPPMLTTTSGLGGNSHRRSPRSALSRCPCKHGWMLQGLRSWRSHRASPHGAMSWWCRSVRPHWERYGKLHSATTVTSRWLNLHTMALVRATGVLPAEYTRPRSAALNSPHHRYRTMLSVLFNNSRPNLPQWRRGANPQHRGMRTAACHSLLPCLCRARRISASKQARSNLQRQGQPSSHST